MRDRKGKAERRTQNGIAKFPKLTEFLKGIFDREGEGFASLKGWLCWAEKVLRLRCAPLRMTGFLSRNG
jgi:hypothetical protein